MRKFESQTGSVPYDDYMYSDSDPYSWYVPEPPYSADNGSGICNRCFCGRGDYPQDDMGLRGDCSRGNCRLRDDYGLRDDFNARDDYRSRDDYELMDDERFMDYDYDDYDDNDRRYMKGLFPQLGKVIQDKVDSECDLLESENSSLLDDEFPNREMLEAVVGRIYDQVEQNPLVSTLPMEIKQTVSAGQYGYPGRNKWLWNNAQVQFYNEFFDRRRRRRWPGRYRYNRYYHRPYRRYFYYQPYVPYYYRYYW